MTATWAATSLPSFRAGSASTCARSRMLRVSARRIAQLPQRRQLEDGGFEARSRPARRSRSDLLERAQRAQPGPPDDGARQRRDAAEEPDRAGRPRAPAGTPSGGRPPRSRPPSRRASLTSLGGRDRLPLDGESRQRLLQHPALAHQEQRRVGGAPVQVDAQDQPARRIAADQAGRLAGGEAEGGDGAGAMSERARRRETSPPSPLPRARRGGRCGRLPPSLRRERGLWGWGLSTSRPRLRTRTSPPAGPRSASRRTR